MPTFTSLNGDVIVPPFLHDTVRLVPAFKAVAEHGSSFFSLGSRVLPAPSSVLLPVLKYYHAVVTLKGEKDVVVAQLFRDEVLLDLDRWAEQAGDELVRDGVARKYASLSPNALVPLLVGGEGGTKQKEAPAGAVQAWLKSHPNVQLPARTKVPMGMVQSAGGSVALAQAHPGALVCWLATHLQQFPQPAKQEQVIWLADRLAQLPVATVKTLVGDLLLQQGKDGLLEAVVRRWHWQVAPPVGRALAGRLGPMPDGIDPTQALRQWGDVDAPNIAEALHRLPFADRWTARPTAKPLLDQLARECTPEHLREDGGSDWLVTHLLPKRPALLLQHAPALLADYGAPAPLQGAWIEALVNQRKDLPGVKITADLCPSGLADVPFRTGDLWDILVVSIQAHATGWTHWAARQLRGHAQKHRALPEYLQPAALFDVLDGLPTGNAHALLAEWMIGFVTKTKEGRQLLGTAHGAKIAVARIHTSPTAAKLVLQHAEQEAHPLLLHACKQVTSKRKLVDERIDDRGAKRLKN